MIRSLVLSNSCLVRFRMLSGEDDVASLPNNELFFALKKVNCLLFNSMHIHLSNFFPIDTKVCHHIYPQVNDLGY